MIHHCGPGIRFDVAQSYMLNGQSQGMQPSGYGMIVEAIGTSCEGVRYKDDAVFQGTSPGYYTYEYKKGVKLVKHSRIVSSSKELSANFDQTYAIKVHEKTLLPNPPLSVSVEDIGKPDEKDKKFMIVSTSSESPVYSSNIADSKDIKEKIFQDKFYEDEEDIEYDNEDEEEEL